MRSDLDGAGRVCEAVRLELRRLSPAETIFFGPELAGSDEPAAARLRARGAHFFWVAVPLGGAPFWDAHIGLVVDPTTLEGAVGIHRRRGAEETGRLFARLDAALEARGLAHYVSEAADEEQWNRAARGLSAPSGVAEACRELVALVEAAREATMGRVVFDERVASELLRYARMVVARGYVHNSLGNIAVRVPHPDLPHGVAYTKHAEVSLEEMTIDNVVVTDIPTPALLHGHVPTSVGHNLNREILRLRPDIGAVIHAHHDETIAFFAAGAGAVRVLSLEFPYVMAMPPHVVPSHLDVENDVRPIADFIAHTNSLIMENHGVTTLGRSLSEAYHRLNTLTSEIRRNVMAEQLAAIRGHDVHALAPDAVDWMYRYAESVIYPSRDTTRRPEGGDRRA